MSSAGSPRSASADLIGAVKSRLVPPSSYSLVVVFATSPRSHRGAPERP
jgi:hypothetical protein